MEKIQTNIMKGYQFKWEIDAFPHVTYHTRDCQLPSVSIDQPTFNTPHRDMILPGSKIIFDPITVTFLVDDDLANYKEVYYWMLKMAFDKAKFHDLLSDATLHILNGDLTPKTSIKFINCHPTLMGDLTFDSGATDPEALLGLVTFEYDYFIFSGDDPL